MPENKITRIHLADFMMFPKLNLEFSPNINIISGENSTGKTALLKLLYGSLKALDEARRAKSTTIENRERIFVEKLAGVFRPDDNTIGRIVSRRQGSSHATIEIEMMNKARLCMGIGNRQKNHMDIEFPWEEAHLRTAMAVPIYIPPKEIISATENFGALYREYQIAFEETYADLCYLLEKPLKRGGISKEQSLLLDNLTDILDGKVVQKEKKFYLRVRGAGEFEMGLVSEGYRKIATIMYLIQSGSLNRNSILFWDEPEANLNPKMIEPLVNSMVALAQMGVQIFVTTHSYFVQQAFNLQKRRKIKSDMKFFSFYRDAGEIAVECKPFVHELEHNAVMEEFDAVYDRDQELFYENK